MRDTAAAATRDYIVHIHADDTPSGATFLHLVVGGVNATSRAQLAVNQTAYTFTYAATGIQNISRNARSTVRIDLQYYNARTGGNLFGQTTDVLRVLDTAPSVELEDDSVEPDHLDADDAAQKTAFRARIGAGTSNAETIENSRDTSVVLKVWQGTEAQYTAITTKDANTLYFTTA